MLNPINLEKIINIKRPSHFKGYLFILRPECGVLSGEWLEMNEKILSWCLQEGLKDEDISCLPEPKMVRATGGAISEKNGSAKACEYFSNSSSFISGERPR